MATVDLGGERRRGEPAPRISASGSSATGPGPARPPDADDLFPDGWRRAALPRRGPGGSRPPQASTRAPRDRGGASSARRPSAGWSRWTCWSASGRAGSPGAGCAADASRSAASSTTRGARSASTGPRCGRCRGSAARPRASARAIHALDRAAGRRPDRPVRGRRPARPRSRGARRASRARSNGSAGVPREPVRRVARRCTRSARSCCRRDGFVLSGRIDAIYGEPGRAVGGRRLQDRPQARRGRPAGRAPARRLRAGVHRGLGQAPRGPHADLPVPRVGRRGQPPGRARGRDPRTRRRMAARHRRGAVRPDARRPLPLVRLPSVLRRGARVPGDPWRGAPDGGGAPAG